MHLFCYFDYIYNVEVSCYLLFDAMNFTEQERLLLIKMLDKLPMLANWFDACYTGVGKQNIEVQDDLRSLASVLRKILLQMQNEQSE